MGTDDVYLDAVPAIMSNDCHDHVYNNPHILGSDCTSNTNIFCRNEKQFQDKFSQQCKNLDNLLKSLRHHYKEVKTKRQLSLDVPAGLRQASEQQRHFCALNPPRKCSLAISLDTLDESLIQTLIRVDCSHNPFVNSADSITNHSSMVSVPIL